MKSYQLAQFNIALGMAGLNDPLMKEFVDNLDVVNSQADGSPGFIWRLQSESGSAVDIDAYENSFIIVNMSVWESVESLKEFTYRNKFHAYVFQKRKDWFTDEGSGMVLWWIPEGHIPTIDEGKERLDHLKKHGPSVHAFNFKNPFEPE